MKASQEDEIPMVILQNDPALAVVAEELIFAVQNNAIATITQLIEQYRCLVTQKYVHFENKTILAIACNDQYPMNNVTQETIHTLIKLGAKYNEPSGEDYWEPLHYTAINANADKMTAIIEYLSQDELNSLVSCSTHVVQKYDFGKTKKFVKTYSNNALNILLKHGNRDGQFYECCKLLIEKGVDVHQADSMGVTPADLIWSQRDDRFSQLVKQGSVKEDSSRKCFTLVNLGNTKKFSLMDISNEEANSYDGRNEETSSCTFLQLCCAKGLTYCVKIVLAKVTSPNKVLRKNPEHPVMIAINCDHEEIVKLLIARTDLVLPDEILLKLQMLYNKKKKIAVVNKYMKMIIKCLRRRDNNLQYLVAKDDLERTVLHYSVHYKCTETTLSLLSLGASLITQDIFGYTPLDFIEADVLEKFFDSCITTVANEEDPSATILTYSKSQQFTVKINYEKLVKLPEERQQESEFLEHMIRVTNLNHLLNHPVVTSFLGLKWQKFKWWVYVNLTLYFVTYVSLLIDAFLFSNNVRSSLGALFIAYAFLLCRDFIQILVLRWNYIKRVENIIDMLLMGAITYIMVISWYPHFHNKYFFIACSVVLLASTLGIFIQLGNLSYFTIKVTMLKQISVNFFKAMVFYMIPVVAFFFCFFMLMQEDNIDDDKTFFDILYLTLTMSSGDSDKDFPTKFGSNVVFAKIVYILFVVVIVIILQNLLIGLAVSDLQDIQNQAKFIRNKEQAKQILKIEKIVSTQLKKSYYFKSLLSKLYNFLQVFQNGRVLVIQSSDSKYINVREDIKGKKTRIHDQDTVKYLRNIFKNMSVNDKPTDELYSNKRLLEKLEKLEVLVKESLNKDTKKEKNERINL